MSSIFLKTDLADDLIACRTCLTTKRKVYSIHEYNISEAYKNLIGIEASPFDGLPQYICNYCAVLLIKFHTFKRNILQAQSYLEDAKIIPSDILTTYHPVSLRNSDIKIIDTQNESDTKLENNDTNHFETQNFEYSNSPENFENEDSKIYTDIFKIEPELMEEKPPEMTEMCNTDVLKESKTTRKSSKITRKISNKTRKKSNLMKSERKRYGFKMDENLKAFERDFNVKIVILNDEQQLQDVLDRKCSSNYLDSPFKCDLCFKGVMDEDSLKQHFLYQHDPSCGPIVCEFCHYRYKDNRGLNQHLISHRLKFMCKQCPFVSRTTFNAKEHFKMHTGLIHECKLCGKSHDKLTSHLTHLRLHHPTHWCDLCGDAFIGRFGLNAHKKRAHRHLNLPYTCNACPIQFVTKTALDRHTSYKNCNNIVCIHCGEGFQDKLELREHLLQVHKENKVFECKKCTKTFSRQSLYYAHYKRTHTHSKERDKLIKPWICEICGKTFPNKSVLQYHQRNHTGERPFQCTQCNKSFTMKKLLQSHLRVHTTDRPYTCKLCPKSFKRLPALRGHELTHTGGQKTTN